MRTREEEQGQNEKDLQQQRPKSSKETGWMEMLFVIIRYQDLDLQDGRGTTWPCLRLKLIRKDGNSSSTLVKAA